MEESSALYFRVIIVVLTYLFKGLGKEEYKTVKNFYNKANIHLDSIR